jgi:hypothetical protein
VNWCQSGIILDFRKVRTKAKDTPIKYSKNYHPYSYRFLLHRNYKNLSYSAWDIILNHSDVDGFDITSCTFKQKNLEE